MKSRFLMLLAAITLFAALAMPLRLAAQDKKDHHKHHHYKLIDIGTFGGPDSLVPELQRIINSRGTVVGGADTSTPDPNAPNCFDPECFVQHTVQWKDGALTDLGALPGVNSSTPAEVNAHGLVAGLSQNGVIDPLTGLPEQRAVLWQDGQIMDLGTLGGNESAAIGMNDKGQVIGVALNTISDPISFFGATQAHAFLWQNGTMQDLGTLGGPDSFGQYVNNRGQVAGFSYTSAPPTVDPFLWDHGTMTDLGTLGGTFGQVNNLNRQGQVVGTSNLSGDTFTHGFLWDRGVLTDVGTFGGDNAEADWINKDGEIAGSADFSGDKIHHAFLWKKGALTDLGTVDGDPCSRGRGINSKRQIVGGSSDCSNFLHAFLWEDGGPAIDLNSLVAAGSGLTLTVAFNISDRGEIAGNGVLSNGDTHAFVLVPCDENHRGLEGCDYRLVDRGHAVPKPRSVVRSASTPDLPAQRVPQGYGFHVRGLATGRTN